jgi:hypothetical protein
MGGDIAPFEFFQDEANVVARGFGAGLVQKTGGVSV